jgi:hypothetical protein
MGTKHAAQGRRLLALAAIHDGNSRACVRRWKSRPVVGHLLVD